MQDRLGWCTTARPEAAHTPTTTDHTPTCNGSPGRARLQLPTTRPHRAARQPRTPTTTGHGSPVSAHRAAHAGDRLTAPEPHEDETSMTNHIREQAKLITAQLLSGAGIASGYAVGGLLAEEITGQTAMGRVRADERHPRRRTHRLPVGRPRPPLRTPEGADPGLRHRHARGRGRPHRRRPPVPSAVHARDDDVRIIDRLRPAGSLRRRRSGRSRRSRKGDVTGGVGDHRRISARAQLHRTRGPPRRDPGHERPGRSPISSRWPPSPWPRSSPRP
jgi:hypothetical protein